MLYGNECWAFKLQHVHKMNVIKMHEDKLEIDPFVKEWM